MRCFTAAQRCKGGHFELVRMVSTRGLGPFIAQQNIGKWPLAPLAPFLAGTAGTMYVRTWYESEITLVVVVVVVQESS